MTSSSLQVFLNRFALKEFSAIDKKVHVYTYKFSLPPEPGKEFSAINRITWKIKTPGVKFGSTIITKQPIAEDYLKNKDWVLQLQETKFLNPKKRNEKVALETLERRWLGMKLRAIDEKHRVEKASEGGYIWWNANKIILQDPGWEVHTGVRLDIEINESGILFTEIDIHHRFYSPWTLEEWQKKYPDISVKWVRNTYDSQSWELIRISKEKPENLIINDLGISLAEYHLQKNATEAEISNGHVIYVKKRQGKELSHISTRVKPSITMEMLSYLADQGSEEAKKVFSQIKQSPQKRFDKGQEVAQWLARNIYQKPERKPKAQKASGILLRPKSPLLLAKSDIKVYRPKDSLEKGCFATGETKFGCLDLAGNGNWPDTIKQKLEYIGAKSYVEIILETPKTRSDLPDSLLSRKQFWQNWSNTGTNTVLVISPWLEIQEKIKLRKEALEANIALQFMQPMPNFENFRAINIALGLLLKAKWQPVSLVSIQDPEAAEIVIGFDAGKNSSMYYGTSAFAILGDGQSLGWEIPEAQPGEKLSGQAVLRTILNIISRFQKIQNRLPKRILLLRDGLIQEDEFEEAIGTLEHDGIAVDLLGIRKSGAGRMAILPYQSEILKDPQPGTVILSQDGETFRIVTSEARAGGAVRPLQVKRDYGNAPLELLAQQVDRLCMLNPGSGYAFSRLPYVIHFADKMAKEVQRLGTISVLHQVDRNKIFFA
ncbi:MAG: argonaute PAZ domain-containing protein [Xenococcus sp. (in: cyanobacteria)]